MMPEDLSSAYSRVIQLSDDNPANLARYPTFLYDCNIHVYDNSIYYGNGTDIDAIATVGSTLTFRMINLQDWFIKNRTAGNNAKVVITGTRPNQNLKEALR